MGGIWRDVLILKGETPPSNSTADLSPMLANRKFGHSHSGALRAALLPCVEMSLLSLPSQIDHSPESPFWRFEIMAVFVVGLWAANSCNAKDVGLLDVYIFPKIKSPPRFSATIGISIKRRSLLSRRFGAHSLRPT